MKSKLNLQKKFLKGIPNSSRKLWKFRTWLVIYNVSKPGSFKDEKKKYEKYFDSELELKEISNILNTPLPPNLKYLETFLAITRLVWQKQLPKYYVYPAPTFKEWNCT